MTEILASIRYNLACLTRFAGRDPRGRFWPYAIFMYGLSIVAGMLVFIPVLVDMFMRMQRYFVEHPEGLPTGGDPYDPTAPLKFPPELMPDFSVILVPMTVVGVLVMLLVAAAVVRRLHDRDRSGWWALLPIPSMIAGQLMAPQATEMMFGGTPPDPSVMLPVLLNNLVYWITLIALIVMLAKAGTEGANRYGQDPLVAA